jgi:hypothetical protein
MANGIGRGDLSLPQRPLCLQNRRCVFAGTWWRRRSLQTETVPLKSVSVFLLAAAASVADYLERRLRLPETARLGVRVERNGVGLGLSSQNHSAGRSPPPRRYRPAERL